VIDDVIALARADDPTKPLDFWLQLERHCRDRWGGKRCYIAKQSSADRASATQRPLATLCTQLPASRRVSCVDRRNRDPAAERGSCSVANPPRMLLNVIARSSLGVTTFRAGRRNSRSA
jgi:hypothetical protein